MWPISLNTIYTEIVTPPVVYVIYQDTSLESENYLDMETCKNVHEESGCDSRILSYGSHPTSTHRGKGVQSIRDILRLSNPRPFCQKKLLSGTILLSSRDHIKFYWCKREGDDLCTLLKRDYKWYSWTKSGTSNSRLLTPGTHAHPGDLKKWGSEQMRTLTETFLI